MPDTEFAPDLNAGERQPTSVSDARDQIFDTRERISETLDQIETRIVDTKQELRRKADVLRPVRERIRMDPWKALAIAAGAGLVLGLLVGARDDEEEPRHRRPHRSLALAAGRTVGREAEEWRDDFDDEFQRERDEDLAEQHRAPVRERVFDHLLHSLTGAVADGISTRVKRAATS